MKLEDQLLAQNWFIFNVFNNFGFIGIVLVLFPLCLFWTNIYRKNMVLINLNRAIQLFRSLLRGDGGPFYNANVYKQRDGFISV